MDIRDLVAEVESVSSRYGQRHGIDRDSDWFMLKLHEEVGELTQAYLMRTGRARTKGRTPPELEEAFRSEVADVLAHLLLLAAHHDIDVEDALERKWLVRKHEGGADEPEDGARAPRS